MTTVPLNMLANGARVLDALIRFPQGIGVSALARELELPVSSVHRLLSTLVESNWAAKTPGTSLYRIGPHALAAGEAARDSLGVPDLHAVLVDLAQRAGESVVAGRLMSDEVLHIDFVQGQGTLRVTGGVGQRMPLHCTSLGKTMLSLLSPSARVELVGRLALQRRTARTITDAAVLLADIEAGLERGYFSAREENEIGVTSVGIALPVARDPVGCYAICLSGPTPRMEEVGEERLVAELRNSRDILRSVGVSSL